MFSSSNPFPSSIHGLPPPSGILFGQDQKYDAYFNHHPFLVGEYRSFDHVPPVKDSDDRNHQNLSGVKFSSPSKGRFSASKKGLHSKIFTARGPRDRRVILSINISKKFFGLQDLLGFDKASKTLDWLFTKSKTAIKDLIEEMKDTSSSTLCEHCEKVFMEKGDHLDKKGKKKKRTQRHKTGFHVNLAARNQLRAEARSRARARTIEKLRSEKLNKDLKINVLDDNNYSYLESRC